MTEPVEDRLDSVIGDLYPGTSLAVLAYEATERIRQLKSEIAGDAFWTCGHVGGAVCAECYRLLAAKAHDLQMDVDRLRDAIDELRRFLAR